MNKKEILKILIDARSKYEMAMEADVRNIPEYIDFLKVYNLHYGMCVFFHFQYQGQSQSIIGELIKDCINPPEEIDYWYPTARFKASISIKAEFKINVQHIRMRCIRPRLEHIKKTILRLENSTE